MKKEAGIMMNTMDYAVLPEYELIDISPKKAEYAVCIPVINEGQKFINQLREMRSQKIYESADIFICDGGSTDGSTEKKLLEELNVTLKVTRLSPGHLSDQLMLGYYFAVTRGYKGCITIDGNGKDGIDGIFRMLEALGQGYDFIQGSRYVKGGTAINTPRSREFAIKLIHVPIINWLSGFHYTDTTNGFRAHSARVFNDPRISPIRYGAFPTYSLIHYLTVRIPELGYRVVEVPVLRQYPEKGKIPTKISPLKGNLDLLKILWNLIWHRYDPKPQ